LNMKSYLADGISSLLILCEPSKPEILRGPNMPLTYQRNIMVVWSSSVDGRFILACVRDLHTDEHVDIS
jgi:hypothetical protein